jgi:hypothetical protein
MYGGRKPLCAAMSSSASAEKCDENVPAAGGGAGVRGGLGDARAAATARTQRMPERVQRGTRRVRLVRGGGRGGSS